MVVVVVVDVDVEADVGTTGLAAVVAPVEAQPETSRLVTPATAIDIHPTGRSRDKSRYQSSPRNSRIVAMNSS